MKKIYSLIPGSVHTFLVDQKETDLRLDTFLTLKFSDYSRNFLQKLINKRLVTLNGKTVEKPSTPLKIGTSITITLPNDENTQIFNQADLSHLNVRILFQNHDFAIIYKPAGLIVHSNRSRMKEPTLVDWLNVTFLSIKSVGYQDRPGIVHRLDKNTSGIMIIPLTNPAFAIFSDLFKNRKIHKTYFAIVKGHPPKTGSFTDAIARHPTVRNKMTIHTNGRTAETHFNVITYFLDTALVEVKPTTGRTHQIRVHFSAAGHPLLGDEIYGSRSPLIDRHALHAYKLIFDYQGETHTFEIEPSQDFNDLKIKLCNQI